MADGKLIVLGEGGLLGLFRMNPKQPEELSRWQVPPNCIIPAGRAGAFAQTALPAQRNRLVCLDLTG